jgi:hypothetical protein
VGSKLVILTVQHRPLKSGDDQAIGAFEDELAKGFNKWDSVNGRTLGTASGWRKLTAIRAHPRGPVHDHWVGFPRDTIDCNSPLRLAEGLWNTPWEHCGFR